MNFLGKIVVLIGIWPASFGCSVDTYSNLNQQPTSSLTDSENEKLKDLLKIVFEDPSKGNKPTDKYNAFLNYQEERISLVEQLADAESEARKRLISRRITRLDQDFIIENGKIKQVIESLMGSAVRLYHGEESYSRIKDSYPDDYKKWEDSRLILVESINTEENELKKRALIQKMRMLDKKFQIKFLWFIAGLE